MDSFVPYDEREEWKDITPIPQNEGSVPVVSIKYRPQFINTMDYFRAIFQKDERSERAFDLVTEVILLNPANYTAWYFRRILLESLKKDLDVEIEFLNELVRDNEKNYQVWHHRQKLFEKLPKTSPHFLKEKEFLCEMLESDSKNYHCWSYRQWFIKFHDLWSGELKSVDTLLNEDVRNNSAWCYRFYILKNTNGFLSSPKKCVDEIQFCWTNYMLKAPNNESVWNYMRGIMDAAATPQEMEVVEGFERLIRQFQKEKGKSYFNSFLFASLVHIFQTFYPKDEQRKQEAIQLLKKLIEMDFIRRKYWNDRLENLL